MTETLKEISEDAFNAHYPLVPNHLNATAGWRWGREGAACSRRTATNWTS